jgi:hypothetical protein
VLFFASKNGGQQGKGCFDGQRGYEVAQHLALEDDLPFSSLSSAFHPRGFEARPKTFDPFSKSDFSRFHSFIPPQLCLYNHLALHVIL